MSAAPHGRTVTAHRAEAPAEWLHFLRHGLNIAAARASKVAARPGESPQQERKRAGERLGRRWLGEGGPERQPLERKAEPETSL